MSDHPHILHVSADFPDPIVARKTPVIRSLLELTKTRFDHRVISLNRKDVPLPKLAGATLAGLSVPKLQTEHVPFDHGVAVTYHAPSRGMLHLTMLRQLGDQIAQQLRESRIPDLLVAHKLTVEGLAVARAAELLDRPYAVTIQGNTDARILAMRPDLAAKLRPVFHNAAAVMTFAPWSLKAVERRLGARKGPCAIIPCPTELDTPLAPRTDQTGLLSMFHLHGAKTKNLQKMGAAIRHLDKNGRAVDLAIAGGGDDKDRALAEALAGKAPGLHFEGHIDQAAVAHRMNAAAGFVLPSRRESFGLVFIEALFSGCPIIYPKGRAVDGYFDDQVFAIGVSPGNTRHIAQAMTHLIDHQAECKQALAAWQTSDAARQFTQPAIAEAFTRHLVSALTRGKQSHGG